MRAHLFSAPERGEVPVAMRLTGLFLGSLALGAAIFALAVMSARETGPDAGAPRTLGSRAGLWLSYAIGLFLMAQGALGLFRLR